MNEFINLLVDFTLEIGYFGFFCYMIIVGTFIPLPTQLILLPAGYLVFLGKLDFLSVALISSLGTTLGASINYKFASYIAQKFLSDSKTDLVNGFFQKYGKLSVLVAPLTPGMGQYISIPAGIAKMDLKWFLPLIFASNFVWNMAMLGIGYYFGQNANDIAKILAWLIFALVIIVVFIYLKSKKSPSIIKK